MTEDLERAVRERIAAGFSPVSSEDREQNVRDKMTRRSTAGRPARLGPAYATAAVLAAVLLGVLVVPRLVLRTLTPVTYPSSLPMTTSNGIGPASGWRNAANSGADDARAAKQGTKRRDLTDAAAHLSFDPVLPRDVAGRGALLSIYTFTTKDGAPSGAGLGNALGAFYVDDLQVIAKKWDPRLAKDQATFSALMTMLSGPADDTVLRGVTVLTWGSPAVGSKGTRAQVAWFDDGVGYALSSSTMPLDRLLTIAETMID